MDTIQKVPKQDEQRDEDSKIENLLSWSQDNISENLSEIPTFEQSWLIWDIKQIEEYIDLTDIKVIHPRYDGYKKMPEILLDQGKTHASIIETNRWDNDIVARYAFECDWNITWDGHNKITYYKNLSNNKEWVVVDWVVISNNNSKHKAQKYDWVDEWLKMIITFINPSTGLYS